MATESFSIPEMHVRCLLKALNGSAKISEAAIKLGLTERAVYYMIRRHDVEWDAKEQKYIQTKIK